MRNGSEEVVAICRWEPRAPHLASVDRL